MTMIIATTRPVVTKTATMRIKQVYVLAQVNNNAVKVVMQWFVHGWASPFLPLGQSGLAQVRVHAVPIEMDGVVGLSSCFGVGEFFLKLLECGGAKGRNVEATEIVAQILQKSA